MLRSTSLLLCFFFFFFNDTATTEIYTLSLHDALPISALAGIKTGSELQIDKLTSHVRMSPEGLKADNFIAVLPQLGNLTGAGTADSRNNLDFKMVATLAGAQAAANGGGGDAGGGLAGILGRGAA